MRFIISCLEVGGYDEFYCGGDRVGVFCLSDASRNPGSLELPLCSVWIVYICVAYDGNTMFNINMARAGRVL